MLHPAVAAGLGALCGFVAATMMMDASELRSVEPGATIVPENGKDSNRFTKNSMDVLKAAQLAAPPARGVVRVDDGAEMSPLHRAHPETVPTQSEARERLLIVCTMTYEVRKTISGGCYSATVVLPILTVC
jgi:hypothetical protein